MRERLDPPFWSELMVLLMVEAEDKEVGRRER